MKDVKENRRFRLRSIALLSVTIMLMSTPTLSAGTGCGPCIGTGEILDLICAGYPCDIDTSRDTEIVIEDSDRRCVTYWQGGHAIWYEHCTKSYESGDCCTYG
jgi:hypothetical protein